MVSDKIILTCKDNEVYLYSHPMNVHNKCSKWSPLVFKYSKIRIFVRRFVALLISLAPNFSMDLITRFFKNYSMLQSTAVILSEITQEVKIRWFKVRWSRKPVLRSLPIEASEIASNIWNNSLVSSWTQWDATPSSRKIELRRKFLNIICSLPVCHEYKKYVVILQMALDIETKVFLKT